MLVIENKGCIRPVGMLIPEFESDFVLPFVYLRLYKLILVVDQLSFVLT